MAGAENAQIEAQIKRFQESVQTLRDEVGKVIVGQQEVVDNTLVCLFGKGHVLLEGVPGLGKTMLVSTLARTCDLEFSRIQFTPDLMPADIIGTDVVIEDDTGHRRFEFRPGPIHSQFILADEINRATPKTQSALLEAMQEGQVTAGRKTYKMRQPFFVMATQNPIEQEGTYPLPEAQMDRFLFKVKVTMGTRDELKEVLARTTGKLIGTAEQVMTDEQALGFRELVREVYTADNIRDFAVRLVLATHADSEYAPDSVKRFVSFGSSPRGAQALTIAGKVYAAMDGRLQVDFADVRRAAVPALRHRMLLNFEGEAEGVDTDSVVADILEQVPDVEAARSA